MKKVNCNFGPINTSSDLTTPIDFYNELNEEFGFTFDPCPLNGMDGPADGLAADWGQVNFVNPPYNSSLKSWIRKGVIELSKGKKSCFLIPARVSSNYWWEFVFPYAKEIRLYRQGISFGEYDHQCPMAIALVIFDPEFKGPAKENVIDKGFIVPRHFSYFKINNQ